MPLRSPVEVFASEAGALQLAWGALPANQVVFEVGGRHVEVEAAPPAWLHHPYRTPRRLSPLPGGPGALVIDGLEPGRSYDVYLSGPGLCRRLVARGHTLPPPPGPVLARFATISDTHIGEQRFGALETIVEEHPLPPGREPYPLRAARAAMGEAVAWGAELMVVKGDLTRASAPVEFRDIGRLLAQAPVPVGVILGNHDVRKRVNGPAILAGLGVAATEHASAHDLAGVRLVLGHSPNPRDHWGRIDAAGRQAITDLAGEAPGPAIVVLHHAPQRWAWETHYPPGIVRSDARPLVAGLLAANPAALLLAGHTHRNRHYRVGGLSVAEVGSTKDYPGQWAGYTVYEQGVTQVVRRIAQPDVIAWTESTKRAIGGLWGWWAPGRLADRCWYHPWPSPRASSSVG